MGSLRIASVRFVVYSNDHTPRHVHCFCQGGEIIINLLGDENVGLADRKKAVKNAKKPVVLKALQTAADHYKELCELWDSIHGEKGDSDVEQSNEYEAD